ncbi:Inner membrane protein YhaI [Roseibium album]|nr:Inner membrane protein YhaI [Roseibium album]
MTTHRKQFGKRGSDQYAGQQSGFQQPQYSPASAIPGYAMAGNSPTSLDDAPDFSFGNVLWSIVVLFFSFEGRINRLGYLVLGLFNSIIQISIFVIYFSQLDLNWANSEVAARELIAGDHFMNLFMLLLLPSVSNISLLIRRFHDRDVSGFWLLAWFIPIFGVLICFFQSLANLFCAGTRGPNRFDTVDSRVGVFD